MNILKWLKLNILFFFVYLFLYLLGFFENVSHIWRPHHYRWRAANFDLCSARMAIEQWWFFSVPHLLWHGASVYNGHLQGLVTLTLLPSVWLWSFRYLFLRPRSIAAVIRTSNLLHARRSLKTTATPLRYLTK